MSQGASTFKMDPAPVFLFTYIVGSVACAGLVAVLALTDPAFQQAKVSVVLETIGYILVFFGPPYAALCALIATHYFQYTVTADGIGGQNLLGKSQFVAWSDIAMLKPIRIGNLEFVRLVSGNGARPIWLPMFVRNETAFDNTIMQWAPQGPVAQAFTPITSKRGGRVAAADAHSAN